MAAVPHHVPFSLTVVPERSEVVIVPSGDIDVSTVAALDAQTRELRASGFEAICIDLRSVVFLDSTGLRTLLALRNDAKRARHRFTLVPGPPTVQRVFDLTATRTLFEWRDA